MGRSPGGEGEADWGGAAGTGRELRGDKGGTKRVKQRGGAQDGAGLRGGAGQFLAARLVLAQVWRILPGNCRADSRAGGKGSFRFPGPWSG